MLVCICVSNSLPVGLLTLQACARCNVQFVVHRNFIAIAEAPGWNTKSGYPTWTLKNLPF